MLKGHQHPPVDTLQSRPLNSLDIPDPGPCFGFIFRLLFCAWLLSNPPAFAGDQPQWGQAWSRNLVADEKGLPDSFDPQTGKNIKWAVRLGTETHSTPVIAGGRVYVGTNNGEPRDPKHQGDRGVLMSFEEKTGRFLWQLIVPKREEDIYLDWPNSGICSPPTVEGDRVYLVSNRGEVMCLDALGMANGNDGPFLDEGVHMARRQPADPNPKPDEQNQPGPQDADILWLFDLTSGAGIWSHDAAHSSILIYGDYLYLNTGTGVDNTHKRIRTPNAPSLVVLDKHNGRLVARDNEHIAPNIFHSTWSSPSLAKVNGRELIFFAGGNGIVYAFEPIQSPDLPISSSPAPEASSPSGPLRFLKKVWQFDFDPSAPKENVHKFNGNRRESPSNIFGMPVFYHDRLYVAGGGDIWWGKNEAWLKCLDATGNGDITATGLRWVYPLQKHVLATPAISEGLVFIADCGRTFHCADADSGKPFWTHEVSGDVWSSAFVCDGKVYLGTRNGNFYVFAASKEKKLLASLQLASPISATSTAANGVLYVATMSHLYAVQQTAP